MQFPARLLRFVALPVFALYTLLLHSWAGLWKDGRGGWLGIFTDESGKNFRFHIGVVRGPTYHSGDISGKATVNNTMAFFTDKGAKEKNEEDPETWLVFTMQNNSPRFELKGVNTQYYHGMRAYFDGTYTRVGDIDEAAKKAILEGKSPFRENRDELSPTSPEAADEA